MIWVDGKFVNGAQLPRADSGAVAPFETMGAKDAAVALWGRHMARLQAAARRLQLSFVPTPELRAAAAELLLHRGHADGILRLRLAPQSGKVQTVMTTRQRSPSRRVTLLPTVVERKTTAPPADLKAEPRRYYDAVLQQAQDGGADDGLVIASDGAVLETAVGNLWLLLDGVWTTPPLDGRVLPGIARAILLERGAADGVAIAERSVDLEAVHRAEALAVSNAVYGPRTASLLGAGSPTVAVPDTGLGALWRSAVDGAG